MDENKTLELANTVMQILDRQPRHNPKLTDHELLQIVKKNTGDNTMQLYNIPDSVSYLELQSAVNVDRFMGTASPAFDHVKISRIGRANIQLNKKWPIPKERARPKYHCGKCDAIVNATDENCPNGHDLSKVGRKIQLTLTEGLTLSDTVSLTSGFVINKIGNIVKGLELEPKTRAQAD